MVDVLFICVIYSKHPNDSETVKSFKNINFKGFNITPKLAVWDNSTEGYGDDSVKSITNSDVFYFHEGKNEKLSVVYNRLIEYFSKKTDWVVILDDDSTLSDIYVSNVFSYIEKIKELQNTYIAVPKIFHDGILISPGMVKGVRGYVLKGIENGLSKRRDLVAMMSGTILCINDKASLPKFDERLSFYGVDTKFFRDASKLSINVYILPVEIDHDSSLRDSSLSYRESFQRFSNLFRARHIIFEDVVFSKFRIKVYLFMFIMKKIINTKDIRYLKLLWK
ncbi:hypothetical protein [Serratia fonticola]